MTTCGSGCLHAKETIRRPRHHVCRMRGDGLATPGAHICLVARVRARDKVVLATGANLVTGTASQHAIHVEFWVRLPVRTLS